MALRLAVFALGLTRGAAAFPTSRLVYVRGPGTDSHAHDFEVNCGKFSLCKQPGPFSVCACNAAGCDASMGPGRVDFDLRFTADMAEGSNTASEGRTDFTRAN